MRDASPRGRNKRKLLGPAIHAAMLGLVLTGPATQAASTDYDGTWTGTVNCGKPMVLSGAPYTWTFNVAVRSGTLTGSGTAKSENGFEDTTEWEGSINGDRVNMSGKGLRPIGRRRWDYIVTGKIVAAGRLEFDGGEHVWEGMALKKNRDCHIVLLASAPAPTSRVGLEQARENAARAEAAQRDAAAVAPRQPEPRQPQSTTSRPSAPAAPPAPPPPTPPPPPPAGTELDRAGAAVDPALAARRNRGTDSASPER